MRPLIQEIVTAHTPESLAGQLGGESGLVVLRTALFDSPPARYSFITARPFLTLRSFGSRCELFDHCGDHVQFGNPWHVLDGLMARYEMLDEVDLPFPLGGCFGYWGYDLKNFVEPRLPRRAVNDLEFPDCHVGFYDSLVVFDHRLGKAWIVSTGLRVDGSRNETQAQQRADFWRSRLNRDAPSRLSNDVAAGVSPAVEPRLPARRNGLEARTHVDNSHRDPGGRMQPSTSGRMPDATPVACASAPPDITPSSHGSVASNLTRAEFIGMVARAQRYIRAGDVYQVNLAQRLAVPALGGSWDFYQRLAAVSPAPFSAYLDCGEFQLASSSPELFLRLSGSHIQTRPIKGTRPRSSDPTRDAQLTYELQTSAKEMAELVMITDLLRNDLGRVCEYGSVQVPELVRLERFPQVQHLVSTVEGRLRPQVTHFTALAQCFPGGSVTGAPKIRAMEIIDELEPVTRGPYTGCLGYLGFNRESQLSILIRVAVCTQNQHYFYAGAGIVADSQPEAEYDETMAKAAGFMAACQAGEPRLNQLAKSAAK